MCSTLKKNRKFSKNPDEKVDIFDEKVDFSRSSKIAKNMFLKKYDDFQSKNMMMFFFEIIYISDFFARGPPTLKNSNFFSFQYFLLGVECVNRMELNRRKINFKII